MSSALQAPSRCTAGTATCRRRGAAAAAPPLPPRRALQHQPWALTPQSKGRWQQRRQQQCQAPRAAALPEAAAELEPSAQQQWAAASELVQQRCGLDGDAADAALLKAFGWKGQAFWRQERVREVPCPDQVEAALDCLAELGLCDAADLGPLVAAFPEVLGLRVEVMQENLEVLRGYGWKPSVLLSTLKRKPRVLGNIIDCQGTCAGLCTRCWAQF